MNEQEFNARLSQLLEQIQTLDPEDRTRLGKLAEETRSRHERMQKTIADLQESLDYLRLSVKYLVFDLEATRRENQYLRKLLEGRNEQQAED